MKFIKSTKLQALRPPRPGFNDSGRGLQAHVRLRRRGGDQDQGLLHGVVR